MKIIHEIINRGKGSYGSGQSQLTRDQLLRIYDETKSISSLILTTNGTSGAATYSSATKTLNIPVYTQSAADGFVPYVGAIANLNLGSNQLIADAVQLSLLPVSPLAPGKLRWNADFGTLDIGMGYTNVVQQVGMDTYYPPIKNQTGSTIAKGTVVMSVGTLGASGRILVAPAVANGTVESRFMLGVAASDMINGADGLAIWFGEMKGFNTVSKAPAGETWINGDVLWINPAIPGGLTKNEPLAPNLKVSIAQVLHAATNGIIVIRPSLGSRLTDLHDVNAFTPATNDLISYDGTKWVNRTLSQLGVLAGTGVSGRVAYWAGTNTLGSSANFTFNGSLLNLTASNPIFRIGTTDNTSNLFFRNVFNEDAAAISMNTPSAELSITTAVSNMDIRIQPHGTGKVKLPNVPTGTGDVLMRDGSNNIVRGPVLQKVFVVPNTSIIGTTPNVTTAGTYVYSYPVASSGYSSVADLPTGTLMEFEFGMEVNCTVVGNPGDMALTIGLRIGTYLFYGGIQSLLVSTTTVRTLHTTRVSFIKTGATTFSSEINQKARRDSGPSYDRDRTIVSDPLFTGVTGPNVNIELVFGQSSANNFLRINHGFLRIVLP
jgi:hypothetical protein